jgi:hypothetical protein
MTAFLLQETGGRILLDPGPGALILEQFSDGSGLVAGGFVTFTPEQAALVLNVGDRYYVAHTADLLPEKFKRVALTDGVWQGGAIFCDISAAYPDSTGQFYLFKTGTQGQLQGLLHQRPFLDSDATRRRNS